MEKYYFTVGRNYKDPENDMYVGEFESWDAALKGLTEMYAPNDPPMNDGTLYAWLPEPPEEIYIPCSEDCNECLHHDCRR